jgi:hypothetical protein
MVADSITRAVLLQATGLDDGKLKLVLTVAKNYLMTGLGMSREDFCGAVNAVKTEEKKLSARGLSERFVERDADRGCQI